MFVDSVDVFVKAGKGGDGIVSFLRDKNTQKGGPNGGHGGRGGNVILVGEAGLTTLIDFRYHQRLIAEAGEDGKSQDMAGASGNNVYFKVPIGTLVYDAKTKKLIGDISKHGQELIVAHGGRGGKGNAAYASPKNTTPMYAEKGLKGEERNLHLELKVLADVGLVGFPSVGKSTLLSVVSQARPKIASYHFTTLAPNLGVVKTKDERSFIMADLPGLIEGSSTGLGLGFQFLQHIERTKVLVHIIDMAGTEGRNPIEDYEKIRNELLEYDPNIYKRPEIVVANKMDMPDAKENLEAFIKATGKEVIAISAYQKQNIDTLLYKIADTLDEIKNLPEEVIEEVYEYKFLSEEKKFNVYRDEEGFLCVDGPEIEKLFERTNFQNEVSTKLFSRSLRDLGVEEKLKALGATEGDSVFILGFEFELF